MRSAVPPTAAGGPARRRASGRCRSAGYAARARPGRRPAGDRLDVHRAVGVEPEVVQPAKGRRVLVLAADRPLEDVDLDPAGLLRQERRLMITCR